MQYQRSFIRMTYISVLEMLKTPITLNAEDIISFSIEQDCGILGSRLASTFRGSEVC